jgi:hypothetical protein
MCSYCHEFIKRNQKVCGYCGKVFTVAIPKEDLIVTQKRAPVSFKQVVAIVFATVALGLVVGGAIDTFFLKPELLETVEISEPADIELVELEPSPYAWQH